MTVRTPRRPPLIWIVLVGKIDLGPVQVPADLHLRAGGWRPCAAPEKRKRLRLIDAVRQSGPLLRRGLGTMTFPWTVAPLHPPSSATARPGAAAQTTPAASRAG
jgi:hypothetical protein